MNSNKSHFPFPWEKKKHTCFQQTKILEKLLKPPEILFETD